MCVGALSSRAIRTRKNYYARAPVIEEGGMYMVSLQWLNLRDQMRCCNPRCIWSRYVTETMFTPDVYNYILRGGQ